MARARMTYRYGDTLMKGALQALTLESPRQRAEVLYQVETSDQPGPYASEKTTVIVIIRSRKGEPVGVVRTVMRGRATLRYLHGHLYATLREAGFTALAQAAKNLIKEELTPA
ncbi:hypothetical protein GURKE_05030 [Brevundimonas phage vB_BpoS-Gurke]|uniref:Uncharacterized protein n=1 Tax=Brevundimonas phage vB_BpoS-Gurke TaxID=2948599 RepID=A0A9E7SSY6_9CAUD|nr:hypothetical protein GURKE_05030 [Brevundimonas phage vB_BpoS-Gurke]